MTGWINRIRGQQMPAWLTALLILSIAAGVVFRLAALDRKVYSHDETLTSLRTSGFLFSEFERNVRGRTLSVAQLQAYQHANAQRGIAATIRTLALDDPQHPPLYYLLERLWTQLFHNSIFARRALGAVFGILTIPAVFWLCRELLPEDRGWGLVAAAFFALSPFEVQYTQQAREYTLWGLLTVVSSALLLRALRTNAARTWAGYAVSIVLGLYAFLFFAFVLAAHAIVAGAFERMHRTRIWRPFVLVLALGLVAYAPWLQNLYANRETVAETNSWFSTGIPLAVYAYKWLFNSGTVFFDAEYRNIWYSAILVPLGALYCWSFYSICRSPTKIVPVFVLSLFGTACAPLLLPDLVLHQSRLTAGRYVTPAWIAIDLAVAYWVSSLLRRNPLRVRIASAVTVVLLLLSAISYAVSLPARAWWTASFDAPVLSIADAINMQPSPLILIDDAALALQLSNYLRPDARFVLSASPSAEFLHPATAVSRFLIDPAPRLRSQVERKDDLNVRLVYKPAYSDSPMLQGAGALSGVRTELRTIRAASGSGDGDYFSLWAVSGAEPGRPARSRGPAPTPASAHRS